MRDKILVGEAELISLPEIGLSNIPARVDTGAKTSAIWASQAKVVGGTLQVILFGKGHANYTGEVLHFDHFTETVVASSNGHTQTRFKVQMLLKIAGRKIRARLTLADRRTQVYPLLIGRNVLRGKFIVDVKLGSPVKDEERARSHRLQSQLKKGINL